MTKSLKIVIVDTDYVPIVRNAISLWCTENDVEYSDDLNISMDQETFWPDFHDISCDIIKKIDNGTLLNMSITDNTVIAVFGIHPYA
jgi:hypothetical protein